MPRNRAWTVLILALATIVLVGGAVVARTGDGGTAAAAEVEVVEGRPVRVVATTNLVADLVRQVGGPRVEVEPLMGPGVDPHTYRATAGDVEAMRRADVIVFGGLHLEGKLAEVLADLEQRGRALAVSRALPEARLIPVTGGDHDPHIWFDPALWAEAAATVADGLAERDPAGADAYAARAAAYAERLDDLAAELRAALARVPAERRVLVTSHDAFGYFGRAFDVDVAAIQGISTASEATISDVDRVARIVAERRVPTLFVESSVPPQTVEAVRAAARAAGFEPALGRPLFSDSAGDAGTPEETLEGVLAWNVSALVEGLA